MSNCKPCFKSCPVNSCNIKIKTLPCDPNSKKEWFKYPNSVDQVRINILNGCWLCNYEPNQSMNNQLCNRNFYDGYINKPWQYNNCRM